MNLKLAQFIGLNTDQKAAQAISSIRDSDNAFLAVIQLTCDDAFTKGRLGLAELSDYYFDFEGSPVEKLTATFKEAENKFKTDSSFDLVLAAISGKVLYLIGQGNIEVYLKRADKLSPLLSVAPPAQLVSGFLQDEDRLLLGTKELISFLADDLSSTLSLSTESFEQELSDRIGASTLQGQGLAALLLYIPNLPPRGLDEPLKEENQKPLFLTVDMLAKISRVFLGWRGYFPKSGRGRLILASLLIAIIALGIGFKYKTSQDQHKIAQFNQALQEAKDNLNAAEGLASLNTGEAKNKLEGAKDKVSKALELDPKSTDAENLKKLIHEKSSSILQESSVSDFPLFLDMDLIKKNFYAKQMSLSSGKLLLLDPDTKTLVLVDLAKKSNQILAGENQLGEGVMASLNGGLAFVYSKDKGVLRVDSSKNNLTSSEQKVTNVSKKDEDWGDIKDIYGFAGNVYLLDSKQIWKYLPTSGGYSDKREYLTKGATADFSNALRMQIESSVYILNISGEILRFTRGEKDNFSLGGLPSGVKDPKSLFVSSDTDNLYLLDSGNSRLLILTKTGSYKGTISGQKFATAADLVVDEKGKKVYLLEGGKIYSVDLK